LRIDDIPAAKPRFDADDPTAIDVEFDGPLEVVIELPPAQLKIDFIVSFRRGLAAIGRPPVDRNVVVQELDVDTAMSRRPEQGATDPIK
jgi:hypothetical protein